MGVRACVKMGTPPKWVWPFLGDRTLFVRVSFSFKTTKRGVLSETNTRNMEFNFPFGLPRATQRRVITVRTRQTIESESWGHQ